MICLALGFKSEQPALVDVIDRAHARGILVFSAASNGQNFDAIYCPAIITHQVFCIFAADAGGREARSLNPSPAHRSCNFAIFGEHVEVNEGNLLVTGTSYATAIATGLAAALLDFTRQTH